MASQALSLSLCKAWANRVVIINRDLANKVSDISSEVWTIFPVNNPVYDEYRLVKVSRSEIKSYDLLFEHECKKHVFNDALLTEYTL